MEQLFLLNFILYDFNRSQLKNTLLKTYHSIICNGYLFFPAPGPGPGPQFVFNGPGPQFVFNGPGPQFVFTSPGTKFVFTGPGP